MKHAEHRKWPQNLSHKYVLELTCTGSEAFFYVSDILASITRRYQGFKSKNEIKNSFYMAKYANESETQIMKSISKPNVVNIGTSNRSEYMTYPQSLDHSLLIIYEMREIQGYGA